MSFVEIPIFEGFALRQWIDWMEKRFAQVRLSESQKVSLGKTLISGDAKTYIQHWRLPFHSWYSLKVALLFKFGDDDDPEKLRLIEDNTRFVERCCKIRAQQDVAEEFLKTKLSHVADHHLSSIGKCLGTYETRFDSVDQRFDQLTQIATTGTTIATTSIDPIQVSHPSMESDLPHYERSNSFVTKIAMPRFNGSSPFGWLLRLEKYFQSCHVVEDERLGRLSECLEGEAFFWYKKELYFGGFRTWCEFKRRLVARFSPVKRCSRQAATRTTEVISQTVVEPNKSLETVRTPEVLEMPLVKTCSSPTVFLNHISTLETVPTESLTGATEFLHERETVPVIDRAEELVSLVSTVEDLIQEEDSQEAQDSDMRNEVVREAESINQPLTDAELESSPVKKPVETKKIPAGDSIQNLVIEVDHEDMPMLQPLVSKSVLESGHREKLLEYLETDTVFEVQKQDVSPFIVLIPSEEDAFYAQTTCVGSTLNAYNVFAQMFVLRDVLQQAINQQKKSKSWKFKFKPKVPFGADFTRPGRGQPVAEKGHDTGAPVVCKNLDMESNVYFPVGGAGTWSDGKLMTQIEKNSGTTFKIKLTIGNTQRLRNSQNENVLHDNPVALLKIKSGLESAPLEAWLRSSPEARLTYKSLPKCLQVDELRTKTDLLQTNEPGILFQAQSGLVLSGFYSDFHSGARSPQMKFFKSWMFKYNPEQYELTFLSSTNARELIELGKEKILFSVMGSFVWDINVGPTVVFWFRLMRKKNHASWLHGKLCSNRFMELNPFMEQKHDKQSKAGYNFMKMQYVMDMMELLAFVRLDMEDTKPVQIRGHKIFGIWHRWRSRDCVHGVFGMVITWEMYLRSFQSGERLQPSFLRMVNVWEYWRSSAGGNVLHSKCRHKHLLCFQLEDKLHLKGRGIDRFHFVGRTEQ
ncbi:uncharacterized protein LOC125578396 [Brassica napus]|nr:uncharacterized protein LOC125578396 [Brassica napus]